MKTSLIMSLLAIGVGILIWVASAMGGCCGAAAAAAPAPAPSSAPASQPASKPKIANAKCPIMGSKLEPDKVPANLTRQYKGQTIGFCCGGCPAQWDKLSDADKDAKLAGAVVSK